jgi:hypothetical protein
MTPNAAFFTDAAVPGLIGNVGRRTGRKTLKGWSIHVDNARPHNSERAQRCIEASRAKRLTHPACTPDRAPSDFFILGCIQRKRSDYNCENREDLLNTIAEILTGVGQERPLNVLESWVN